MKKIIYLASLLLVVATVNVGCEKESIEPENPPVVKPDTSLTQTLEQKYPDWKNLVWISTNGDSKITIRPQFSYKIIGNDVIESVKSKAINGDIHYNSITIDGNKITFLNTKTKQTGIWFFSKRNDIMSLNLGETTVILKIVK